MNSNNPFAEQSQYTDEEFEDIMTFLNEDPAVSSTPNTAPETSLPHGSVGQNEFGQDVSSALSNDQYWQHPPPETLTNNSGYYSQEQTDTSGSVQPGHFVPGIYSPGGYEQVRLQYQHRTEPTVARDSPSSLDNEASYSPAAANPSYNTGTTRAWNNQLNMYTSGESVPGQSAHDWNLQGGHNHGDTGRRYQPENNVAFVATGDPPAPQLSENKDAGTGEQAAEGADSAGAVKSTTPKHILEKEKQARAAIRKLKAKTSMDGQMGESITMVRTNTGVEFSGTMWKAPANDVTIPTTEDDIKACVNALDLAMHNVENIREKADVKSSNNRWNSESKYYFPEEYNAAAGLLVKELIKIHTDGWTKQIFDQNEREQCQLTQFYTFEDRFEGLRELLHYSKTSCQDIMKGSRFYTIIANPRNLIHRTATNKTANVNKGQQIRAGKVAIKKESSKAASSSATPSSSGEDKNNKATQQDGEEGSNSEESTKVKKASRGKKRVREETFVAEDPAGQAPRKKAPVKKRRSE
ncbi:uncharacterized protein J4E92_008107 [Alternaria infectoria]|uniref:uncharacterized protein n=1 Tax=Alternaria infectoria TaxID=45303 RepID=UPI00221EA65A|nr:uncharacterized protein J4E92_008107 [Alternaria infectoria]KAI4921122.1 hypothetical protein J4E92_008107 [Alternaria infectoria]